MKASDMIEESDEDWNRKAAVEEVDSLKSLRATSWEQHSHSFKWLTASLLALNGGAIVALSQSEFLRVESKVIAGSLFSLGLAFALLVAVIGQKSIAALLIPLQKQIRYWMTVSLSGVRNEESEAQLAADMQKSVRIARASQFFGWLSATCLFVGIAAGGQGMIEFSAELSMPDSGQTGERGRASQLADTVHRNTGEPVVEKPDLHDWRD